MTDDIRYTIIDGNQQIVINCDECPFYDGGDNGYGDMCKYPGTPLKHSSYNWTCEDLRRSFKVNDYCPLKKIIIAPNDIMARCDRCNSTDLTLSEFLDGHMLHCNACGLGMRIPEFSRRSDA